MVKHDPLKGKSYIQLPNDLENNVAILCIQNFEDHKCLNGSSFSTKWSSILKNIPSEWTSINPSKNE